MLVQCSPAWTQRLPRPVLLTLKPVMQALALLWMMLCRAPRPDVVLLQLPPAIPTMAVVSLACWWHHHAKLVYDWHNFGFTLMALSVGRKHWLVSVHSQQHPRSLGKLSTRVCLVTILAAVDCRLRHQSVMKGSGAHEQTPACA